MDRLDELKDYAQNFSTAPSFEDMPRKTLEDKGIAGPTAAHFIEEIHTPLNFSFITATTGSQAFQNITAVTPHELPARENAAVRALELAGVKKGSHLLFTYPPLVNVFTKAALLRHGVTWGFLLSSGRDAFLWDLCQNKPDVVVGESSFLRAALEDTDKMGLRGLLPQGTTFLAAGTPLDLDFIETAKAFCGGTVHDLYGCQEFGWLCLNGIPLRDDISLRPAEKEGSFDLIAGGLPTGDCFPVTEKGHACNAEGKIITYSRVRAGYELVTTVHATTAAAKETADRLARGILRIKSKIVCVAPDVKLSAENTILSVAPLSLGDINADSGGQNSKEKSRPFVLDNPSQTELFDSLLLAQADYQSQNKKDPAWMKKR